MNIKGGYAIIDFGGVDRPLNKPFKLEEPIYNRFTSVVKYDKPVMVCGIKIEDYLLPPEFISCIVDTHATFKIYDSTYRVSVYNDNTCTIEEL